MRINGRGWSANPSGGGDAYGTLRPSSNEASAEHRLQHGHCVPQMVVMPADEAYEERSGVDAPPRYQMLDEDPEQSAHADDSDQPHQMLDTDEPHPAFWHGSAQRMPQSLYEPASRMTSHPIDSLQHRALLRAVDAISSDLKLAPGQSKLHQSAQLGHYLRAVVGHGSMSI